MTKEQAIEVLRCRTNLGYGIVIENESTQVIEEALETVIKALEQQPSEDKITISFDKGTLKHSEKDYVVYNKDWLRKHFATEVKIMTGHEGYKQSEDCVSRQSVLEMVNGAGGSSEFYGIFERLTREAKALPPVIPTFPKGVNNGDMIKAMFPTLSFNAILSKMYASCGQGLLDWWNAPYKRSEG